MALAKPASADADLGGGVGVATPSGPPIRKIWEIEIIRGLAVTGVLIGHVATTNGVFPDGSGARWLWALAATLPVLFGITGFVLYAIPDSPLPYGSKAELRTFLVRRYMRFVPAYWVAFAVLAIYPGLPGVPTVGDSVRFLTFTQIYSLHNVFAGIGPAWTLCVDVTVLIFISCIVLVERARLRPKSDVKFFGGMFAIVIAGHVVAGQVISERLYFQLSHTLVGTVDWFFSGVMLGLLRRPDVRLPRWATFMLGPRFAWPAALVVAVIDVAILKIHAEPYALVATPGWATHLLQTLTAFLILAPATTPRPLPTGWRRRVIEPLVYLGTISFGLYIWHRPLITWIHGLGIARDLGVSHGFGLLVATLAVTIPLAILSWRLVERPAIRLSRRLSQGGFRRRDAEGNPVPPWRPGPETGAAAALIVAGVLLVVFPDALSRRLLLSLLGAALALAVYAHVATERRDGRPRRFGIAAPLPAFALAFVLVLGVRAVSLVSGHDGRYFTGGAHTELKLTAALQHDLPENGLRQAVFDPSAGVRQRLWIRPGSAWVGKQGWRWEFQSHLQLYSVAAQFPDAIAALEHNLMLVTPDEKLGAYASVRINWRARPPTGVQLYARFFDAKGTFVSDVLAASIAGSPRLQRARWRPLGGTLQAPPRAASAVLVVQVRFPPAGRPLHLDVDSAALVPGARTPAELASYLPRRGHGVWASAIPRALSFALAMLLCVVAGYVLAGRRGLLRRRLPARLADPGTPSGRKLVLVLLGLGVLGWIWEMATYGGYGAYLDQLHSAGVTERGHWYQHTIALLPTGLAVYLTVRLLGERWRRPQWWEAATIAVGAFIALSYLLKTTIALPVLTALIVLSLRRPRLGIWIVASGAVLAILTPFVYAVRGAGRIDPGPALCARLLGRLPAEPLVAVLPLREPDDHDPARAHGVAVAPLSEIVETAIPRAVWEGKPDSTATRFTHDYLLAGLHSPTDIGVLSLQGEIYLIGGAAGIVLFGLGIGLLLRVARDIVVAGGHDTLALLVAATLTTGLIFLNDGWGIASTIIVLGIAELGWLVMVRRRRVGVARE